VRSVFVCFFLLTRLLSSEPATGQIFTKSSPADVLAVLFVTDGTAMKIGLPKNSLGLKSKNVRFWCENSDSAVFGRPLRRNEEEFWEN